MKFYHASETSPDRMGSQGLIPGVGKCLDDLINFLLTIKENELWGKWPPEESCPDILNFITSEMARCQVSRDVFVARTKDMALANCHSSIGNKPTMLEEVINPEFEGIESGASLASYFDSLGYKGNTAWELTEDYIKKNPCYLCEIEIPDKELAKLRTHREAIKDEISLSHVPSEYIINNSKVSLEEDKTAWKKVGREKGYSRGNPELAVTENDWNITLNKAMESRRETLARWKQADKDIS